MCQAKYHLSQHVYMPLGSFTRHGNGVVDVDGAGTVKMDSIVPYGSIYTSDDNSAIAAIAVVGAGAIGRHGPMDLVPINPRHRQMPSTAPAPCRVV